MTTGERIQKARKAAKLSQKELGDKLGVSASMIGQYENNLRKPKLERVLAIANALSVNPSDIADLEETLMVNLEPMVTIETEDGDFISATANTREGQMLSRFQALNELGKDEVIRYTDILLETNKYRSKPLEGSPQEE